MSRAALLLALLLGACSGPAPHEAVGETAAELEVGAWVQAPAEGTSLADLRGRVVYLEFWATW